MFIFIRLELNETVFGDWSALQDSPGAEYRQIENRLAAGDPALPQDRGRPRLTFKLLYAHKKGRPSEAPLKRKVVGLFPADLIENLLRLRQVFRDRAQINRIGAEQPHGSHRR